MGLDLFFKAEAFDTVLGGMSVLNIPRLNIRNIEQARNFLLVYGFDPQDEEDSSKLWYYHRRAVSLIEEELLVENEIVPVVIADRGGLGRIENLLIYASRRGRKNRELQRWACAVLRVMHVFVHLDNDLFNLHAHEIQQQILQPLQKRIVVDPDTQQVVLGTQFDRERISLHRFDVKPFKTSRSAIVKMLARPDTLALFLLDKLGVRFVTNNIFDAFRVVRFLVEENIISFAHIVPDQSNNTLYPTRLFLEVMTEIRGHEKEYTSEEIADILNQKIQEVSKDANYLRKENLFTGKSYRFIKFIVRKKIVLNDKKTSFFYPFEVQIMDYDVYLKNLSGPGSHDEYKERQKRAARLRVLLGRLPKDGGEDGTKSGYGSAGLF